MICHKSLDLWISRHRFTRPSQVPEVQTLQTSQHCTLMIDCKNCHLSLFGLKVAGVFLLSCFSFFVQAAQGQLFLKDKRKRRELIKLLDRISLGTNKGTRARMLFSCLDTDLKINRTDHYKKNTSDIHLRVQLEIRKATCYFSVKIS